MSHEKKGLQATSIIRIISVCKEAGVREFALGDLRISFYGGEGFSGDIEHAIKRNVIPDNIIGDDIEKSLNLIGMQIKRQNMICSRLGKERRKQASGNRFADFCLTILPRVTEIRHDEMYLRSERPFQRIEQYKRFHVIFVDVLCAGLHQDNFFAAD